MPIKKIKKNMVTSFRVIAWAVSRILVCNCETSAVIAFQIGASPDVEEKFKKQSTKREPRFVSWVDAAQYRFEFMVPDKRRRKKIKASLSRKPEVSTDICTETFSESDDQLRLMWPVKPRVKLKELQKELRRGTYTVMEDVRRMVRTPESSF